MAERMRRRRLKSRFGRRQTPPRNPAYLEYIRGLDCLICGAWPVEAAHTGAHGMGQKASDYSAIPLCWSCHREGPNSNHRLGRNWATHHGIDLDAVRSRLLIEFETLRAA